ncbi:hypothetical protein PEC302107_00550 [Pectobacterium araliae]|uniref:TonB C-terminal domain-containing protein n=1 Tax=Pectobacterium araliae TaxID=3073862 RepID=A0AAN0KKE5_9GAMM|nr:hypothetical protein PEC302110_03360 [Pectobacterium sp. MAFF 302110]GKW18326.1 hypothetical protein PEC302107_00550 [Pectobacterium carotovorum subsp. carotovorum]
MNERKKNNLLISHNIVRWTLSPLIVLALHGSVVLFFLRSPAPSTEIVWQPLPEAAPIVVELAAVSATVQITSMESVAQAVKTEEVAPEQKEQPAFIDAEVKEVAAAEVNVAVGEKPKLEPEPEPIHKPLKPVHKPKPRKEKKVEVAEVAKQTQPAAQQGNSSEQLASRNQAFQVGAASNNASRQVRISWESELLAKLQREKRYPAYSLRKKQQDTILVKFTLDKDGNVLNSNIIKSQGFESLENESMSLIKRASPLPKPPATALFGDKVEMVVPIEFFIRNG